MKRIFFIFSFLLLSLSTFSMTKEFDYTHLGNFNGLIHIPDLPGKLPVIIYAYDEFYDWAGHQLSQSTGYNLHSFAEAFANWGYIVVIPIERYRKVTAIKGVFEYLKDVPKADLSRIHMIGVSEGALLNLVVYQEIRTVQSLTLIAPVTINDKGYLSLNRFKYFFHSEDIPVLFLEAKDLGWRINAQRDVLNELNQHFNDITYYSFDIKKRYFWEPSFSFMSIVREFLDSI